MSTMIWSHKPNKLPFPVVSAPGDTNWHDLTIPATYPKGPGIEVAINCINTAGTGNGSVMFVAFNLPASGPPAIYFPILPGQTLIVSCITPIAYKMTVGTDQPFFCLLY